MTEHESTAMRINFTRLMQDREYSVSTRLSLSIHIRKLGREPGDKIVKELMSMVESGILEQEFRNLAQEKYGITMLG